MYCTNCGNLITQDNNHHCNNCGNLIDTDKSSILGGFIAYFIPTVGVILYFLLRSNKPNLAKSFKNGLIINFILSAIFIIFAFIIFTLFSPFMDIPTL